MTSAGPQSVSVRGTLRWIAKDRLNRFLGIFNTWIAAFLAEGAADIEIELEEKSESERQQLLEAFVKITFATGEISRITLYTAYDAGNEIFSNAHENADDALYEIRSGWGL